MNIVIIMLACVIICIMNMRTIKNVMNLSLRCQEIAMSELRHHQEALEQCKKLLDLIKLEEKRMDNIEGNQQALAKMFTEKFPKSEEQ